MDSISKSFSLILILIISISSLSLLMVKPAFAQTVSFTQWHTSSDVIQPPSNRTADIPPILEIVSPENQATFQTSSVTLIVDVASYYWIIDSVDYQADWQVGLHQIFGIQPTNYEDALNATITVTFTQIPTGNHTLEIYATTNDGMHAFATVTFLIEGYLAPTPVPTPTPTSTPTVPEVSWLIILLLFIFLLSIAVIVRLRKTWKVTQH